MCSLWGLLGALVGDAGSTNGSPASVLARVEDSGKGSSGGKSGGSSAVLLPAGDPAGQSQL